MSPLRKPLAALAVGLALLVGPAPTADAHCHPGHEDGPMGPPPQLDRGAVKGEFDLVDVNTGARVTHDSLDGSWRLVFFGFTSCHVVCPTGLLLMSGLVDALDQAGVAIVPVFITVDPDRDTPDRMRAYLGNFDARIVGLRGTDDALAAAMRSFRIEAPKMEVRSETEYQLDHPALMMLMDPSGAYVRHIPSAGDTQVLADQLLEAIRAPEH